MQECAHISQMYRDPQTPEITDPQNGADDTAVPQHQHLVAPLFRGTTQHSYSCPRSSKTSTFHAIGEDARPLACESSWSPVSTSSFRFNIFFSDAICLSRNEAPRAAILTVWGSY